MKMMKTCMRRMRRILSGPEHVSSSQLSGHDVRFPRLEKPWKLDPSQVKTTHLQEGFRTDWWLNIENDNLSLR
jgi:hypothetical protein